MPTSTLRLTTGFCYWNSLHDLVLFHKPPWRDAFSSDPQHQNLSCAAWPDLAQNTTLSVKRQVPRYGSRAVTFLWEFNTFTGFFCSWGLLTSSFLGKKHNQATSWTFGWGQSLIKVFSPHTQQLNWASTTTAFKWWGDSLLLFFCRLDTTALLLGTATS